MPEIKLEPVVKLEPDDEPDVKRERRKDHVNVGVTWDPDAEFDKKAKNANKRRKAKRDARLLSERALSKESPL